MSLAKNNTYMNIIIIAFGSASYCNGYSEL